MQDRVDTLEAITGLPVTCHSARRGAVHYFVFGHESSPIKTVWTYRKAKVFAEGFAAGRSPIVAVAYPPGA